MPTLPNVLARRSGAATSFTLAMDAELPGFQGHFPDNPILPGVVQVDWAVRFGAQAFGDPGEFRAVEQLKFKGIIRPGETVQLDLAFDPALGRLRFRYHAESGEKSSGTVLFTRAAG